MSLPPDREIFEPRPSEGRSKVQELSQAVHRNVKPGMTVHLGGRANAAACELIRQFWGSRPDFTVVAVFAVDRYIDLVGANLVQKLLTANSYEYVPTAGPSKAVQAAYKEKRTGIESWSILSLIQRLMAGALDLGFMPTKSIRGSSMAKDNSDSFQEIEDPFTPGSTLGVLKALSPDISVVHGLAADEAGNTILAPDLFATGEAEWGALASRGGVVVTVEKIVSTDFIRKYSSLVRIPGYLVNSVTEVSLGAHPQGLWNLGMEGVEGYGPDYEFAETHRKAVGEGNLEGWLKEWVLDLPSHQDYLRKLGYARLMRLKGGAARDAWQHGLVTRERKPVTYDATKMMVVAAARQIIEKVRKNDYDVVLGGAGVSALPPWMAYYLLKAEGREIDLLQGCGLLGYAPRPADPRITSIGILPSTRMVTDSFHVYGVFMAGQCARSLGILGAGEIDKYGNINSTRTAEGGYLIGSGGANDAVNAREVLVIGRQGKRRFVEKVPYITCPGTRVTTLVSSMGVFEKLGEDPEFTLTGYFAGSPPAKAEDRVREIKENCGWELRVASQLEAIPPPTGEEMRLLGLLGPEGIFSE
ncbi:MAG: CoA-transferase [Chloroflexota bacterium]